MLLTKPIVAWVRETSPPYGEPPASSPADVAQELVEAWHALARADTAVALAEGDTLRLVADQRIYVRLGFSSFHGFCVEAVEMTASTGKRRVATSRLVADVPELRAALIEGTISQCQALALRPVVTSQSAAWWIALASRSTVSELRAAVREARRQEDPEAMDDEESPEGRCISIPAPVAARLAFEEGLEYARTMLGYDAPRHACVAAMLAEVAGDGLTAAPCAARKMQGSTGDPTPEASSSREAFSMPGAPSKAPVSGDSSNPSDGVDLDSEPSDARQRRLQRHLRSQHRAVPFATSIDARRSSEERPAANAAQAQAPDRNQADTGPDSLNSRRHGAAAHSCECDPDSGRRAPAHSCGADADSGRGATTHSCGSDTDRGRSAAGAGFAASTLSAFLRESMTRAERTVAQVYEQLDSFHELLEESPTQADAADPASLVERLEEIRSLAAPIHVLSLRILLHLEDMSAARYLGARTQDVLADTHLRLSPRTYRQLLAEAWQMKRRPELEEAYLSGRIGVSRLRLLGSIGSIDARRLKKFLERARRVTLRQMKRELRLREKLVVLRDQLRRERDAQELFAMRHRDVAQGVRPGPNHDRKDRPPVLVLSDRYLDPLGVQSARGQGLDAVLACILLQHGHLASELQRELTRPSLCTPEEAAALIDRARALANASRDSQSPGDHRETASEADEGRVHGRSRECDADAGRVHGRNARCDADSPDTGIKGSGREPDWDACREGSDSDGRDAGINGGGRDSGFSVAGGQGSRFSSTDGQRSGSGDDGSGQAEFEIYQRDPAANPAMMRRLEVLTDLALLSVCEDSVLVGSEVYPRGRQSLNLPGDFCRISLWAPETVIEDLNRFFDNLRERTGPLPAWASLIILVRDAVDAWKQVDPKTRPRYWRVFERDEHRCQVPGCSKRRDMHAHHVEFRSQGGSNDPSNLVAACYGHHQHGVHDGYIYCTGNANRGLRWVLGCRAKRGRPFRVYQGDLRID